MNSIKKCYAELLSLTQLFLLREYPLSDVKIVDPAVMAFFQKKMGSSPPLNIAKTTHPISSSLQPTLQSPQAPTRLTTTPPSPDPRPPETRPEPIPPSKPDPIPPNPLPPPTQPEPPPSEPVQPPIMTQTNLNKTKSSSKGLTLEPLSVPASSRDHRDFWNLFPSLFPELTLCESVPNDSMAQKFKNAWLKHQEIPSVVILSFHDGEKELAFLKNVAQAISLRLAPARVLSAPKLEKENSWETMLQSPNLHLMIASDYGLYLQPGLMRFYREVPQQGKHYLNHIPLLLLSDLSLYLKEPQLKSLLWRAICNEFAASQSSRSTC